MVSYSTWEMGIHRGRKLFANSFPSGMERLRIIVTGNYLRMVSYSTWDKGDSSRQETSRKSFLSGMGQWYIIATGNCSAGDFSTPLRCARNDRGGGNYCVSWRQGTSRKSFLSGMGRWQIIVAGNCLRIVSHPAWGDCIS